MSERRPAMILVGPRCSQCGHVEDSHDGYGGLCDGFADDAPTDEAWNDVIDSRQICGCQEFRA